MSKLLGKLWGVGIDVRECKEVEIIEKSEGKI